MARPAKITAYNLDQQANNGCTDFSLNAYWGEDYKNQFYLCGDLGRPTFNNLIETTTDLTGQNKRIQNTSIERYQMSVIAISPLLSFLNTIDKHDVKQIEFLDTGDVYTITNIDIDDQGDTLTPVQLVNIIFEDEPITRNSGAIVILDDAKQAFWDNNNDGVKNIDGDARYIITLAFESWQLYFESDGTTPATSGDVIILAYAVSQQSTSLNPVESLIGVFQGEFLDLFSDSTKWQSSQQIWDYFDVADKVGHTNRCRFDKQAFAEDNGYFSDETEDRAVKIRFDISIDGSSFEPTTLALVYTLRGALHSAGIQSPVTSNYGYTTLGKVDRKNTLSSVIDTRLTQPALVATTITSFVLDTITPYSNQYIIETAPAGVHTYQGAMTTSAGYVGSNLRGGTGPNNYTFGPNDATAPSQQENILNFTTGISPLIINIPWKYDKVGAFGVIGDILLANAATIQLDGILNSTPAIAKPSPVQVLGTASFTLPDTEKHVIRFDCPTDGGFIIFTEFEIQVKPQF